MRQAFRTIRLTIQRLWLKEYCNKLNMNSYSQLSPPFHLNTGSSRRALKLLKLCYSKVMLFFSITHIQNVYGPTNWTPTYSYRLIAKHSPHYRGQIALALVIGALRNELPSTWSIQQMVRPIKSIRCITRTYINKENKSEPYLQFRK